MKKRIILMLILILLLTGCNNKTKGEISIPTTKEETNITEKKQESTDWKKIYTDKINTLKETEEENYEYAIIDIDDNGLDELLILSLIDDSKIIDIYSIYDDEITSLGSLEYNKSELYDYDSYLIKVVNNKEEYNIKIIDDKIEEKQTKESIDEDKEYNNTIEFNPIKEFNNL